MAKRTQYAADTIPDERGIQIIYRSLDTLEPYARNARTHSAEQIGKIRASLARYGWTNPMLTAENQMIAGHARLAAAIAMRDAGETIPNNPDPTKGPTVDLSHLAPEDRRAYIIADNRLAEDAGWDTDLLRVEMSDLSAIGFDLAATGFSPVEIKDILTPPVPAGEDDEREMSPAENDMLDVAWRRLIGEWHEIMTTASERPWVSTTFTKGALAVLYLRSLFLGSDIPRAATLAYTGNRLHTNGDKGPVIDILGEATRQDNRSIRNSIRWATTEKPLFDKIIGSTSLPIHGHRMPADFPALLARDLINEFVQQEGGAVLDPCHGWGGRMLGFLLSGHATHYHGFDPSPQTSQGVRAMFDDLSALTPDRTKTADLVMSPFEGARLADGAYDFALTSPPYYDTEKYDGEQSSWRQYSTFEDWRDGFYLPLIAKVAKALKPRGFFALQVGSQSYPLKQTAIENAAACHMGFVEVRHTSMINNRAGTDPDDGEVIVILRRL